MSQGRPSVHSAASSVRINADSMHDGNDKQGLLYLMCVFLACTGLLAAGGHVQESLAPHNAEVAVQGLGKHLAAAQRLSPHVSLLEGRRANDLFLQWGSQHSLDGLPIAYRDLSCWVQLAHVPVVPEVNHEKEYVVGKFGFG